jgi:hypothetical protein
MQRVNSCSHIKVRGYGFNPDVFHPRTLVPIKRVLEVPLANEISEVWAQSQRVNSYWG